MIYQFLALLVVHWHADFVCQTHWQASNKSKNNVALFEHVAVYGLCLLFATMLIFTEHGPARGFGFVIVNAVLHFATDWCTSRITSRLFMKQFAFVDIVMPPLLIGPFEKRTEPRLMMKYDFNLHWFFVVVGLDQLIHQLTLAGTMLAFYG